MCTEPCSQGLHLSRLELRLMLTEWRLKEWIMVHLRYIYIYRTKVG